MAIEEDGTGEVRARLEQEMARLGPEKMHRRLAEVDSEEAKRTHPNNKVRVIRALEIFELTGKSKSHLSASGAYKRSKYNYEFFCLAPPRAELYAAINRRVDSMLAGGLCEELKRLVEAGLEEGIRKANIIGYKELVEVRDGRWSLEQAVSMIKQNSRQYAKRQMTWFRHQADCRFFPDRHSLVRSVKPM
jgi:tRNA dimethylallyltransferase